MTLPVTPYQPPAVFDQQASVPTTATLQNAATSDGTGTDYDITGMATVQLLVNPTSYTGTVTFWASIDGTTFIKIKGNQQDTTTIADNVANPGSTTSIWTFQTAGLTKIRAALTSSGGTSVTVTGAASPLPNSVPLGVTLSSAVLAAGTALIGTTQISDGTTSSQKLAVDTTGAARFSLQAPLTPVTSSATGSANATLATASLPAVSGKTNYITGFSVTTQGGTGAAAGLITITGTISGTLNYQAGCAANSAINLNVRFSSPIPASASNTAITVNVPAFGANTGLTAAVIDGFVQ